MNGKPTLSQRMAAWALYVPGLIVAVGAGAVTAHGLFEVALAARVPKGIAWVYPLITDGLALVAYIATPRLTGSGRLYAWAVVVLAAGLSGLAQAMYLAGGMPSALSVGDQPASDLAPPVLRFGVGAWPAIAAAIVAHLLFLLGGSHKKLSESAASAQRPATAATAEGRPVQAHLNASSPSNSVSAGRAVNGRPSASSPSSQPARSVQPGRVQPFSERGAGEVTERASGVQPGGVFAAGSAAANSVAERKAPAALERARAAARQYAAQHGGELPTATQLQAAAGVSRGTAGTALKDLRTQPPAPQLHVVHDTTRHPSEQATTDQPKAQS